jgi:hypothetical protein
MRLRPRSLVFVLASLVSFACADDEPTVEPANGTWNYVAMGVENNTCPNNLGVFAPSTTYLLDYDGGDGFQIDQADQPDIICNLVGGPDFVCPDRLVSSDEVTDLNLTIEIRVRIDGAFDSDTEAHGEQRVSVTCTGEGCGAFDVVPCSYELPFTTEAQ